MAAVVDVVYHPTLEYGLIGAIAAAGTFLLTGVAKSFAERVGAVATPRDRDIHAVAIPRMGGLAMLGGFVLALFVAKRLPALQGAFDSGPEFSWILVAALIICVIGAIDDRIELDSLTKLAGQILAAAVMVTRGGVQLSEIYIPGSTLSLGRDLAIPVTILLTVLTINAINFIDGLDGLAAGVAAIAAGAFFVFSHRVTSLDILHVTNVPALLSAALAGACLGFLPHNFWPARIFMGDSGSMLIGLMLSAAATTATTTADPQTTFAGALGAFPLALPLLIPIAVLILPLADLSLAVIRRVRRGQSPFAPDKQHLHHRLLELGHSQRRAVILLYFWTALLAFGGVGLAIFHGPWVVLSVIAGGAVLGILLVVIPRVQRPRHL
ncbi:MAG TPA: MraY family glycosyltransferase [Jatrophihabitans sp.]|jgi:UDP-GlcNAc:undecaprenyl-phosphate GlcNAc-1-phosphate transferase